MLYKDSLLNGGMTIPPHKSATLGPCQAPFDVACLRSKLETGGVWKNCRVAAFCWEKNLPTDESLTKKEIYSNKQLNKTV